MGTDSKEKLKKKIIHRKSVSAPWKFAFSWTIPMPGKNKCPSKTLFASLTVVSLKEGTGVPLKFWNKTGTDNKEENHNTKHVGWTRASIARVGWPHHHCCTGKNCTVTPQQDPNHSYATTGSKPQLRHMGTQSPCHHWRMGVDENASLCGYLSDDVYRPGEQLAIACAKEQQHEQWLVRTGYNCT